MPNTLTKGQAIVGKLYGNIAAGAGTISSTEIALANTKLLIGSTSGISRAYALSGDVTVGNTGVAAIGAKKVTAAMHSLANTKIVIGSTASGGVAYALSGDITMTNGGVTAIGAKKVLASMVAIANTKVLIGSTSGAAAAYALSGDVTMSNTGAVTIAAGAVASTMVAAKAVTPAKMGLANTKIAIGSTAGAGAEYALSGDVTMSNTGAVTIAAAAVTSTMLAGGAATPAKLGLANTKIAIGSTAGVGAEYALSGDVTMSNTGAVTIAAGAITSTMFGAGAVNNAALGTKSVYGAKVKAEWSTLSNTTKSVSAVSISAVNKGYFVTNVGSSKGLVISSTAGVISNPTAGDWLKISIAATPSTIPIHLKSTAATFDGTNKYVLFNAVNDAVILEAISPTRWVVAYANSVTYPATT